jgi:hypothetical protein
VGYIKKANTISLKNVLRLKREVIVLDQEYTTGQPIDTGIKIPGGCKVVSLIITKSLVFVPEENWTFNCSVGTDASPAVFGTTSAGEDFPGNTPFTAWYGEASQYRIILTPTEDTVSMTGTTLRVTVQFVEED